MFISPCSLQFLSRQMLQYGWSLLHDCSNLHEFLSPEGASLTYPEGLMNPDPHPGVRSVT